MPFASERQRRFLYAKHPDIAKKFASKEHSNSGRRVGRNPTPGVPRKVGPRNTDRKLMTKGTITPRRLALMRRLAKNRGG